MSELDLDPNVFERTFRELEKSLGDLQVGEAIRRLAELQDARWDNIVNAELLRVVQLHAAHYSHHQGPVQTIRIGRNPVSVSTDRDLMMAAIGFMQGATFIVAARQAKGEQG